MSKGGGGKLKRRARNKNSGSIQRYFENQEWYRRKFDSGRKDVDYESACKWKIFSDLPFHPNAKTYLEPVLARLNPAFDEARRGLNAVIDRATDGSLNEKLKRKIDAHLNGLRHMASSHDNDAALLRSIASTTALLAKSMRKHLGSRATDDAMKGLRGVQSRLVAEVSLARRDVNKQMQRPYRSYAMYLNAQGYEAKKQKLVDDLNNVAKATPTKLAVAAPKFTAPTTTAFAAAFQVDDSGRAAPIMPVVPPAVAVPGTAGNVTQQFLTQQVNDLQRRINQAASAPAPATLATKLQNQLTEVSGFFPAINAVGVAPPAANTLSPMSLFLYEAQRRNARGAAGAGVHQAANLGPDATNPYGAFDQAADDYYKAVIEYRKNLQSFYGMDLAAKLAPVLAAVPAAPIDTFSTIAANAALIASMNAAGPTQLIHQGVNAQLDTLKLTIDQYWQANQALPESQKYQHITALVTTAITDPAGAIGQLLARNPQANPEQAYAAAVKKYLANLASPYLVLEQVKQIQKDQADALKAKLMQLNQALAAHDISPEEYKSALQQQLETQTDALKQCALRLDVISTRDDLGPAVQQQIVEAKDALDTELKENAKTWEKHVEETEKANKDQELRVQLWMMIHADQVKDPFWGLSDADLKAAMAMKFEDEFDKKTHWDFGNIHIRMASTSAGMTPENAMMGKEASFEQRKYTPGAYHITIDRGACSEKDLQSMAQFFAMLAKRSELKGGKSMVSITKFDLSEESIGEKFTILPSSKKKLKQKKMLGIALNAAKAAKLAGVELKITDPQFDAETRAIFEAELQRWEAGRTQQDAVQKYSQALAQATQTDADGAPRATVAADNSIITKYGARVALPNDPSIAPETTTAMQSAAGVIRDTQQGADELELNRAALLHQSMVVANVPTLQAVQFTVLAAAAAAAGQTRSEAELAAITAAAASPHIDLYDRLDIAVNNLQTLKVQCDIAQRAGALTPELQAKIAKLYEQAKKELVVIERQLNAMAAPPPLPAWHGTCLAAVQAMTTQLGANRPPNYAGLAAAIGDVNTAGQRLHTLNAEKINIQPPAIAPADLEKYRTLKLMRGIEENAAKLQAIDPALAGRDVRAFGHLLGKKMERYAQMLAEAELLHPNDRARVQDKLDALRANLQADCEKYLKLAEEFDIQHPERFLAADGDLGAASTASKIWSVLKGIGKSIGAAVAIPVAAAMTPLVAIPAAMSGTPQVAAGPLSTAAGIASSAAQDFSAVGRGVVNDQKTEEEAQQLAYEVAYRQAGGLQVFAPTLSNLLPAQPIVQATIVANLAAPPATVDLLSLDPSAAGHPQLGGAAFTAAQIQTCINELYQRIYGLGSAQPPQVPPLSVVWAAATDTDKLALLRNLWIAGWCNTCTHLQGCEIDGVHYGFTQAGLLAEIDAGRVPFAAALTLQYDENTGTYKQSTDFEMLQRVSNIGQDFGAAPSTLPALPAIPAGQIGHLTRAAGGYVMPAPLTITNIARHYNATYELLTAALADLTTLKEELEFLENHPDRDAAQEARYQALPATITAQESTIITLRAQLAALLQAPLPNSQNLISHEQMRLLAKMTQAQYDEFVQLHSNAQRTLADVLVRQAQHDQLIALTLNNIDNLGAAAHARALAAVPPPPVAPPAAQVFQAEQCESDLRSMLHPVPNTVPQTFEDACRQHSFFGPTPALKRDIQEPLKFSLLDRAIERRDCSFAQASARCPDTGGINVFQSPLAGALPAALQPDGVFAKALNFSVGELRNYFQNTLGLTPAQQAHITAAQKKAIRKQLLDAFYDPPGVPGGQYVLKASFQVPAVAPYVQVQAALQALGFPAQIQNDWNNDGAWTAAPGGRQAILPGTNPMAELERFNANFIDKLQELHKADIEDAAIAAIANHATPAQNCAAVIQTTLQSRLLPPEYRTVCNNITGFDPRAYLSRDQSRNDFLVKLIQKVFELRIGTPAAPLAAFTFNAGSLAAAATPAPTVFQDLQALINPLLVQYQACLQAAHGNVVLEDQVKAQIRTFLQTQIASVLAALQPQAGVDPDIQQAYRDMFAYLANAANDPSPDLALNAFATSLQNSKHADIFGRAAAAMTSDECIDAIEKLTRAGPVFGPKLTTPLERRLNMACRGAITPGFDATAEFKSNIIPTHAGVLKQTLFDVVVKNKVLGVDLVGIPPSTQALQPGAQPPSAAQSFVDDLRAKEIQLRQVLQFCEVQESPVAGQPDPDLQGRAKPQIAKHIREQLAQLLFPGAPAILPAAPPPPPVYPLRVGLDQALIAALNIPAGGIQSAADLNVITDADPIGTLNQFINDYITTRQLRDGATIIAPVVQAMPDANACEQALRMINAGGIPQSFNDAFKDQTGAAPTAAFMQDATGPWAQVKAPLLRKMVNDLLAANAFGNDQRLIAAATNAQHTPSFGARIAAMLIRLRDDLARCVTAANGNQQWVGNIKTRFYQHYQTELAALQAAVPAATSTPAAAHILAQLGACPAPASRNTFDPAAIIHHLQAAQTNPLVVADCFVANIDGATPMDIANACARVLAQVASNVIGHDVVGQINQACIDATGAEPQAPMIGNDIMLAIRCALLNEILRQSGAPVVPPPADTRRPAVMQAYFTSIFDTYVQRITANYQQVVTSSAADINAWPAVAGDNGAQAAPPVRSAQLGQFARQQGLSNISLNDHAITPREFFETLQVFVRRLEADRQNLNALIQSLPQAQQGVLQKMVDRELEGSAAQFIAAIKGSYRGLGHAGKIQDVLTQSGILLGIQEHNYPDCLNQLRDSVLAIDLQQLQQGQAAARAPSRASITS